MSNTRPDMQRFVEFYSENDFNFFNDDELFRDFDTSCFDPAPSSIVSANIPSPAVAHQSVMEVKMFPCNPYPPSNSWIPNGGIPPKVQQTFHRQENIPHCIPMIPIHHDVTFAQLKPTAINSSLVPPTPPVIRGKRKQVNIAASEHGSEVVYEEEQKRPNKVIANRHKPALAKNSKLQRVLPAVSDPLTLIPVSDVRRTIGTVIAQISNRGDAEAYKSFILQNFCVNSRYIMRYTGESPYGPDYLELDGIQSVIQYWCATFLALPDSFIDIQETTVQMLPNGETATSCKYTYTGTQVLRLVTDTSSMIIVSNPDDLRGSGVLAFQVEGDNRLVKEAVVPSSTMLHGIMKPSRKIQSMGTMTFYFDIQKRITRVENIHTLWEHE